MTTSSQLQLRRGTAAQVAAFTGAAGEVTPDTTNNRLVLHDGTTAGGHPQASEAYVDDAIAALPSGGGDMFKADNLSGLASTSTALTNLGGTTVGKALFTAADAAAARSAAASAASGTNSDITSLTRSGGVPIIGTNTNDNAAAGYIGEYLEAVLPSGSAVGITTATAKTVTSLALTAGDWLVSADLNVSGGTTTQLKYILAGIMTTTNTAASGTGNPTIQVVYPSSFTPFVTAPLSFGLPPRRISIASGTTYYLTIFDNHTVDFLQAWGAIRAWRVR